MPKHIKNYARRLFPEDKTGQWRTADKEGFKKFKQILRPEEREIISDILGKDQVHIAEPELPKPKPIHRPPLPEVKDVAPQSRRPGPEGHHPPSVSLREAGPSSVDRNADLSPPPGFQEGRPQSKARNPASASAGKAHAQPQPESPKPGPSKPESAKLESSKPKHTTLAELLAAEKKGERKVRFATQAEIRVIPAGEDFERGQFSAGPTHDVFFESKDKPKRRPAAESSITSQVNPGSEPLDIRREAQGREPPASFQSQHHAFPSPPRRPQRAPARQESDAFRPEGAPSRRENAPASQENAPAQTGNASGTQEKILKTALAVTAVGGLGALTVLGVLAAQGDPPSGQPNQS